MITQNVGGTAAALLSAIKGDRINAPSINVSPMADEDVSNKEVEAVKPPLPFAQTDEVVNRAAKADMEGIKDISRLPQQPITPLQPQQPQQVVPPRQALQPVTPQQPQQPQVSQPQVSQQQPLTEVQRLRQQIQSEHAQTEAIRKRQIQVAEAFISHGTPAQQISGLATLRQIQNSTAITKSDPRMRVAEQLDEIDREEVPEYVKKEVTRAIKLGAKPRDVLKARETAQKTYEADSSKLDERRDRLTAVFDDLDRADGLIGTSSTGLGGYVSSYIKGSNYDQLMAAKNSLEFNLGLDALQSAKEGSATGASGFGPLNKSELELLKGLQGNLDPLKVTPAQFKHTLRRIRSVVANAYRRTETKHILKYGSTEEKAEAKKQLADQRKRDRERTEAAIRGEGVFSAETNTPNTPSDGGAPPSAENASMSPLSRNLVNTGSEGNESKKSGLDLWTGLWGDYFKEVADKSYKDPLIQGATLGFSDEIAGGLNVVKDAVVGNDTTNSYTAGRDKVREDLKEYSDENPLTSAALEMAGGLAVPGIGTGGAASKTALQAASKYAKAGAVTGGIYGAGKSEGDLATNAKDAAIGATGGAVLGGALGATGKAIANKFAPNARKGDVQFTKDVNIMEKYNIPITKGQKTGDEALKRSELSLAHSGYGNSQVYDDQVRKFHNVFMEKAGASAKFAKAGRLTDDAVDDMKTNLGKEYDNVLQGQKVSLQRNDINSATKNLQDELKETVADPSKTQQLMGVIQNFKEIFRRKKSISGEAYQKLRSRYSRLSSKSADRELSYVYKELREILDDAYANSAPPKLADQLKKLRKKYTGFKILEDLNKRRGVADVNVNTLTRASARRPHSLPDDWLDLARAYTESLSKFKSSGTSENQTAKALLPPVADVIRSTAAATGDNAVARSAAAAGRRIMPLFAGQQGRDGPVGAAVEQFVR